MTIKIGTEAFEMEQNHIRVKNALLPTLSYNGQNSALSKKELKLIITSVKKFLHDNTDTNLSHIGGNLVRKIDTLTRKAEKIKKDINSSHWGIEIKNSFGYYENLGWHFTFDMSDVVSTMNVTNRSHGIDKAFTIVRSPLENDNHKKARLYMLNLFEKWFDDYETYIGEQHP